MVGSKSHRSLRSNRHSKASTTNAIPANVVKAEISEISGSENVVMKNNEALKMETSRDKAVSKSGFESKSSGPLKSAGSKGSGKTDVKRRFSPNQPDLFTKELLWKYYPKQVQNILKKKRIDRDRLQRSLKPPGKRNFKILFSNMEKVTVDEIEKFKDVFSNITQIHNELTQTHK